MALGEESLGASQWVCGLESVRGLTIYPTSVSRLKKAKPRSRRMSKHYITVDCSSAPTHKQVLLPRAAVGLASSSFSVKPPWKSLILLVEHHFILLSYKIFHKSCLLCCFEIAWIFLALNFWSPLKAFLGICALSCFGVQRNSLSAYSHTTALGGKEMQFTGEITKKRRWQRVRFLKVKSNSVLLSEAEICVTSVPFLWQEKSLKMGLLSSWLVALIWGAVVFSLSVGEMQMKSVGNWAKGRFFQTLPSCADNDFVCLQHCFV